MPTRYVVSLSGGKDSTWMLHQMLEDGDDIAAVLAFDGGWEFPQMLEHWDEVERRTGVEVVRVHSKRLFSYWMTKQPVIASKDYPNKGICKGEVHRYGKGWPAWNWRWCTGLKRDTLRAWQRQNAPDCAWAIGYAANEPKRKCPRYADPNRVRYPLREHDITEAEALRRCLRAGYTWGGIYEHFSRVSCFCCPLKGYEDLRQLRAWYPDLWQRMLDMDDQIKHQKFQFREGMSLRDVARRLGLSRRRKLRVKGR